METVDSSIIENGECLNDSNIVEHDNASKSFIDDAPDREMDCCSDDSNNFRITDQENICDRPFDKEMSPLDQNDRNSCDSTSRTCDSATRENNHSDTDSVDKKWSETSKATEIPSQDSLSEIYRYRSKWVGKGWCATCNQQLDTRDQAKSHMSLKHARDMMYQCEYCQYRVRLKSRLTRHCASVHSKETSDPVNIISSKDCDKSSDDEESKHTDDFPPKKLLKCKFCFYEVYSNFIRSHMFSVHHMKRSYQPCRYCNYKTVRVSKLCEHLYHHRSLQMFNCSQCDYKTVRWQYLSRHMISDHADLVENDVVKLNDEKERCKIETGLDSDHFRDFDYRIFICDQCFFTSSNHTKVNKHILQNHINYLNDDFKQIPEHVEETKINYKDVKMDTSMPKKFFCKKCDFVTIHESLFHEHLACTHMKIQNIQMFSCEYCSFTTCYPHSVKRHYSNVHIKANKRSNVPTVREFQCDFCLKIFKKKIQLRKHLTQDHDEDRPYNCNICDFKTASVQEIPFHMRLHT